MADTFQEIGTDSRLQELVRGCIHTYACQQSSGIPSKTAVIRQYAARLGLTPDLLDAFYATGRISTYSLCVWAASDGNVEFLIPLLPAINKHLPTTDGLLATQDSLARLRYFTVQSNPLRDLDELHQEIGAWDMEKVRQNFLASRAKLEQKASYFRQELAAERKKADQLTYLGIVILVLAVVVARIIPSLAGSELAQLPLALTLALLDWSMAVWLLAWVIRQRKEALFTSETIRQRVEAANRLLRFF